MGAQAYATGNHVVFGAGGQSLRTAAHEAAHVVQQQKGVALSGGVGIVGDPLEQHADAVADCVVQRKSAESLLDEVSGHGGGSAVQMSPDSTPGWCEGPGVDADQSSMLDPTQSCAETGAPFTQTPEPTSAGGAPAGQGQQTSTTTTANTVQTPTHANAAPAGGSSEIVVPPMPQVFDQESVLATWVALFNISLKNSPLKARKLRKLTEVAWADDSGLSLAKLKAAAAVWQPPEGGTQNAGAGGGDAGGLGPAAPETAITRILMMMASSNGLFKNVFDTGYYKRCLQFSVKFMKDLGAKRADGSDSDSEKRSQSAPNAVGPMTAAFRGRWLHELPATLPAGYQICIVSRPDWGFTEVGNHWFLSAGGGYFLDGTSGVFDAAGMTQNLLPATCAQWGRRVMDLDKKRIRSEMAQRFLAETKDDKDFEIFKDVGRHDKEKDETIKTKVDGRWTEVANPDFLPPSQKEAEGKAAIEGYVRRNLEYHPKIWLVEPPAHVTPP